jgi:hypothetical protein
MWLLGNPYADGEVASHGSLLASTLLWAHLVHAVWGGRNALQHIAPCKEQGKEQAYVCGNLGFRERCSA